ncbi:hypothetical protein J3D43_003671 [Paenibacillus xylanexedens]|uniref:hypothetical protein n=1 Tax=Paenibacillus xylanexedens TaxID=528191 RepID=UPI00209DEAA5|nr:hypothetical protein [Paenibacillus xylanexedens]MCP1425155.1 hypothetical protein [Paenibacillus xylanexedens]
MPEVIKLLASDVVPSSSFTNIYTVPTSTSTILKSFILCNVSTAEISVFVRLNGTSILNGFKIKAGDTIVVPVVDQVMSAGETISIAATIALVNFYICGVEYTTNDPNSDYYYSKMLGRGTIPSGSTVSTIVNAVSNSKRLLKGLIVCNGNASANKLDLWIAGRSLISQYPIKPGDTILIPTMDAVLEPNAKVEAASSLGLSFYLSGKEVT